MTSLWTQLGRTRVMGVLNVTPDSFSDGGRWMDADSATQHGLDLVAHGADVVDVGGESTRPGAIRIDEVEELRRVIPVVRGLADTGVTVSVDTMRARVAAQALEAGAAMINDVSGGRADPGMFAVAAAADVPFVVMHWRAHSSEMQGMAEYANLVVDVISETSRQIEAASAAGVSPERIIVDPGLGFSKTGAQNWEILARLDAFAALGFPFLVAASRKRFLGELLAVSDGDASPGTGILRPTSEREAATVAVSTMAAEAGAWAVRVHEPQASADAVRVVARTQQAAAPPGREER